jgi:hypothetical protein
MKTVVFTAALVFILAPPALANCLTDSIGDNSPRALERYLHCREMESRIETLERAQQDRANAERVHQEGERDRRCITITKTTEQYFDCVRAGRPKVTKEQFEDVRRHLFPETQTPELNPRAQLCSGTGRVDTGIPRQKTNHTSAERQSGVLQPNVFGTFGCLHARGSGTHRNAETTGSWPAPMTLAIDA